MVQIEVSAEIAKEFERLKAEVSKLYEGDGEEVSNDLIMEAMIGGFFDSLAYMQKQAHEGHDHGHHHHHNDHECCGGGKCEDKGDDHECSCH